MTPEQARADCETFISNVFCPAIMGCATDFTMEGCLSATSDLSCAAAKGENGMLAACETDIVGAKGREHLFSQMAKLVADDVPHEVTQRFRVDSFTPA